MWWRASLPPPEDIRIGVCGGLDMPGGKYAWYGAILAAEQINGQGGILGRNVTIVAEDDNGGVDLAVATNAMTKLITVDKADYIITSASAAGLVLQDVCATHKKIQFSVASSNVEYTQRVLDDYDKYKYFFRVMAPNTTAVAAGTADEVLTLRSYTGFNKVAYLVQDWPSQRQIAAGLNASLMAHGFEIVYGGVVPMDTTDFTSYLTNIEASGAEVLYPIFVNQASISLVKDWYDRQSPFVLWGQFSIGIGDYNSWNFTEGKCNFVTFTGGPVDAGYPFTNKTAPFREAYIDRWKEAPTGLAAAAYDVVSFILPEAIKRAGTFETEAVIKALEKTDVETTLARHFVFTSSHDVMIGAAGPNILSADYMCFFKFQWQNGVQVPVYPREIMEEAGANFKYPPWQGPWSSTQTP